MKMYEIKQLEADIETVQKELDHAKSQLEITELSLNTLRLYMQHLRNKYEYRRD